LYVFCASSLPSYHLDLFNRLKSALTHPQLLPETKGIPLEEMAKIFGDEVVVTLDDVHVNHTTHELVVGGGEKGGLEHVATHQGMTPEVERAIREEHDRREKGGDLAERREAV
jgi:hypothetical protein